MQDRMYYPLPYAGSHVLPDVSVVPPRSDPRNSTSTIWMKLKTSLAPQGCVTSILCLSVSLLRQAVLHPAESCPRYADPCPTVPLWHHTPTTVTTNVLSSVTFTVITCAVQSGHTTPVAIQSWQSGGFNILGQDLVQGGRLIVLPPM